jgi:nucleoside-diphosphate-sugar epimerase
LKQRISVIGCGWLGLSLAEHLISEGYAVKGSTTSSDKLKLLKEHQIEGFIVNLNETKISGDYSNFLSESDTVIINIPPGLRKNPNKNHVDEIRHLIAAVEEHHIKQVLYISSTSVFKDEAHFPKITDNTEPNAISNNGKQLIAIEKLFQNNSNFKATILRFGGLFDDQRHPSKFLSGRSNVKNPEAPINLIHKEDCIQIITAILKNKLWNKALNAVYPLHTDKKTYYSDYCRRLSIPVPEYNTTKKSEGKVIQNNTLVQLLNYTFKQTP